MSFACHQCGSCCRQLGTALATAAALPAGTGLHAAGAAFPHAVRPDGSCSQLRADHRCGVYENRPLLCDVDRLFDALAVPGLCRADWHALNAAGCPPAP